MTDQPPVISLLTDFGLDDEYVGVMKGVIFSGCPQARIVDLCHSIPAQNIARAASMLAASYAHFPPGTIHLTVVDPGVGTARHILVVEADGHLFIAPDNGVRTPLLRSPSLCACHRLKMPSAEESSATFHGRDIMAPAAAQLAAGAAPATLGDKVAPADCLKIKAATAVVTPDGVTGEVSAIDHFGNIATTISTEHAAAMGAKARVIIGDTTLERIHRTYGEVAEKEPLALIDSRGFLEIAVNRGDAAAILDCRVGDRVRLLRRGKR
ncbi:MAG TPA: SAM-dependent chlorinase/fluorinase [Desulfopila sp.]|nr:SAM-dependent chlorinase/fluorinase [Desulfopila sp.]